MDSSEILELFRTRANRPLNLKDIQRAFDLSAGERKELGQYLKGLVRDGALVQLRGGRFVLPDRVNLVVGTISLHRDGYGFVAPLNGQEPDLFIPARFVRPAMHGDKVVARKERSSRSGKSEGRVIRIEERAHRVLVARFCVERSLCFASPLDPRLREDILLVPDDCQNIVAGQVVQVAIDSYPGRTRGALGHIVEVLGDADDPEVEIRTAAIQFGLPDQFSPQALTDAATLPLQVEAADLAGRTDLRQKAFVTIDGETAKDFDDAVAIDCVNDGYRLFVAIADVSHYVAPGDAIDQEAQERGTSVYFPGSCLPMLPEALSNGICSLNPGVDRLVMVAQLDFDAEGKRTDMCFYPAVICSHARLTYTEVAAILVEKDDELRAARAELLDDLERMKCLAQLRIERRRERGSLDFDLPEAQIQLDLKGRPENIIRAERNLAHRLIEEFMLAANEAVAKWLTQRQQPLLFRVHEAPSEGRMADFQQFIANFNQGLAIPVQGITQKLLLELLERVAGCPEEHVINHVLLRSLPQAYYTTDNLGHFGLAAEYYCHFTSPIRRYPDLMVHRILKQRLTASKSTFASEPSLEELAGQTSLAERRALEAERDIVKLKKCQFIADKLGLDYDGVIASVHAFGFFVELRDVYIEGLVHISTLEDDFYQFEEERHRLIGTSRRREFTIGDRVRVRVQKVDLQRREIDFSLVEAAKAPKARRRSTTGGRRRKRD